MQIAANGKVQSDGKGRKRAIMMTLVDKEAAEVLALLSPAGLHADLRYWGSIRRHADIQQIPVYSVSPLVMPDGLLFRAVLHQQTVRKGLEAGEAW